MSHSKTSASYWSSRLFFHKPTASSYSAKIQFDGRRERFSLGSANREIAASTAAEIYRTIKTSGWIRAMAIYKQQESVSQDVPRGDLTIGEYLQAVRGVWDGKAVTLNLYIRALRKILSEIFNLDPGNKRFNYTSPAAAEWHDRIDQVPLSAITDAKVNKWKMTFYAAAEPTETARNKRKISANLYLRNARSLFAKRLAKSTGMELPSPLPFAGVEFFGGTDSKYFSTFDIQELLEVARKYLAPMDPDAYSVVLLASFVGLRRNEIDLLEWPSIDFEREMLQLRITDHYSPKTPDSLRAVPLRDPDVLDWFRQRKLAHGASSGFVVAPMVPYAPDERMDYYRCDELLDRVVAWLKTNGVGENKALHALRKEAGSNIVGRKGLMSAATFLRHKTPTVTAQHYTDSHITETPSFGFSTTSAENVVPFQNPKKS
jgi:integrase